MNYQYVVVEVDAGRAGLSRDELVGLLVAENFSARRYFYPGCHAMEPYRSYYPSAALLLPVTVALCDRVMCLPTGQGVTPQEIDAAAALLAFAVAHAPEVRARIAALQYPLPLGPGFVDDLRL